MLAQMLYHSAVLLFLYMSFVFILSLIKKDNSIVDIAWGGGFALITYYSFFSNLIVTPRHILVTALITAWAARLSLHIAIKNWGKKEDPRYTNMKKNWGALTPLYSFLIVFMLQGFLILVIGYPILLVNSSITPDLSIFDALGTVIWLIGFLFETIGDWQLYIFLKNKEKEKVMQSGLWRYTRHPNYFGEVTLWWGIFLIALSVPYGYTAIISPLVINYLLIFLSGIPMAEAQMNHIPAFQEYKKRTSAFFPLPPKKESNV